MNIFCGSLPWSLEESELKARFEAYGEVSSVRIITDKFSGKSKGFGFVEMPNDSEAQEAIEAINGSEISGRSIVVNEAEERKEGGQRRSGGGGGGFRGGNNRGGGFNRGGGSRDGGYKKERGSFNRGDRNYDSEY